MEKANSERATIKTQVRRFALASCKVEGRIIAFLALIHSTATKRNTLRPVQSTIVRSI